MAREHDVTVPRRELLRPSPAAWQLSWADGVLLSVLLLALGGFFALGLLSPGVLFSLALLGAVPLCIRKLIQWPSRRRHVAIAATVLLILAGVGVRTWLRYGIAEVMTVPTREYSNAEYPEDPAIRSAHFGSYNGRKLKLVQKDATHFDFILEPQHPHVGEIVIRDVDVSLITPSLPDWTKEDHGLRRIALTERQWNRQQVRFDLGSPHLEVSGGDGFERANLYTAELAKNCLNAGLWEVLLFVKEGNGKALYYRAWFTFPLGHYKNLFERNTGLPFWRHWYYLEHWLDPAGTVVPMAKLRAVTQERAVATTLDPSEEVIAAGEQIGKRRTTIAENIVTWGDFYSDRPIRFASFIAPGRYSVNHPRKNQYWRMDRFEKAILRQIISPAAEKPLHELELVFASTKEDGICRFFVSGFDLQALPQLPMKDYPKAMYMPMGISVPPFFQSYEELRENPPEQGPYVSVLLDAEDRWIDHHSFGIDGPVMHRDEKDPDVLHVYLLSYERHSLIGHFVVSTHAR